MDKNSVKRLNQILIRPESPDKPYYVLLVGLDSRGSASRGSASHSSASRSPSNGSEGCSDTIILARIDPVAPAVSLLSIPRDARVIFEENGAQRTDAAFSYSDPPDAVRVVSGLCDVEIAHFVEIDFEGMAKLVDRLGGVDAKIPVEISLGKDLIPAGNQHLDGHQALVMIRCRNYPDGDCQRMKNLVILLQAIARKVQSAGKLQLPGLISKLTGCIKMDMSVIEAIQLMQRFRGMDVKKSLSLAAMPSRLVDISGVSSFEVDGRELITVMAGFKKG